MAVVIGSTIGSGIFRSPAGIADKLPGPLPMMAVWVAGGIFALCGALTMAEIASALPFTGGVYVFCREGWGRLAGFLFGWGQIVMIRAASLGAIAITFAEYAFRVSGHDPALAQYAGSVKYLAAGAILLTGAFNYIGVRFAANVSNFTVLAKYGGLLFIVIVAFAVGLPATGGHYTPAMPEGSFTLPMFGLALVSTLWAFDGWADLAYNAGEVKDPGKNLPRALIGGTLMVLAIYLAANLAYLAVLPIETMRHSKLVAADVAQIVIGPAGVVFVSVTVMISTFGTLNTVLFTSPRVFFAMADDGLFFKPVAKIHPKFGTPYVSIAMTAGFGAMYVLFFSFERLADAFVTAFLPFYLLAVAAIFRLRKRPGYAPTFRAPLFPLVPLVFIASVLYLLGNALIQADSRGPTLIVLGLVATGIPVYFVTVGKRR
jgi:amino acid transporter